MQQRQVQLSVCPWVCMCVAIKMHSRNMHRYPIKSFFSINYRQIFFLKEQLDLDVSSLVASTRLDLELHYTEINRN